MIEGMVLIYLALVFAIATIVGMYRRLDQIDDSQSILALLGAIFIPILLVMAVPFGLGHLLGMLVEHIDLNVKN